MKRILRTLENILKTSIISGAICSILTFSLIIINAIMGIFVGLDYYLIMFAILTVCLTIGLTLCNHKNIFASKQTIKKCKKSKINRVSKERNKEELRVKRKIS
ncbi:MAG: hypothetical protein ACRDD7_11780 [Peptostreptococcaceae bacterium]